MANVLSAQPMLSDLYGFISKIDSYPVSVNQLLKIAQDTKAPQPVQDFYKLFRPNLTFEDEDELVGRSEQVGIMRQEESEMPSDGFTVPGED